MLSLDAPPNEFEFLLRRSGGRSCYFEWSGGKLLWYHESVSGLAPLQCRPVGAAWQQFWEAVERANTWDWEKAYGMQGDEVPEVEAWRLHLVRGAQSVNSRGGRLLAGESLPPSPSGLALLVDAVQRLVGG